MQAREGALTRMQTGLHLRLKLPRLQDYEKCITAVEAIPSMGFCMAA